MVSQPHEPYRCANDVVQATVKSERSLRPAALLTIRGWLASCWLSISCPHDLMVRRILVVVYQISVILAACGNPATVMRDIHSTPVCFTGRDSLLRAA